VNNIWNITMCAYDGWACFIEVHTSRWEVLDQMCKWHLEYYYVCIWWLGMFHKSAYISRQEVLDWMCEWHLKYYYVCIWWMGTFHISAYIWTKSLGSIVWQYLKYYYECILWLVMLHKNAYTYLDETFEIQFVNDIWRT